MKQNQNKMLTGLELKVMNLLWDREKAFVKELIEQWSETPVPAYNTVSTVVRILQEKGYVGHEAFGRSHRYFPKIERQVYQKRFLKNVLKNVFSGSVTSMVSSLVDNEEISDEELGEIRKLIDDTE
ncbi:MAG: BlaI/MecI/CopY family transcriptional regulator [Bacteroidota bacterium]